VPLNGSEPTSGRETRLLVLVVLVSLAVLLLLARFQYPESTISTVTPSPGPLAGMAARATFEEMALTLAGALKTAGPAVDVIRLEPAPVPPGGPAGASAGAAGRGEAAGRVDGPRVLEEPLAPAVPAAIRPDRRFVPALRVRPDLVLLHVPAGWRAAGVRDLPDPLDVAWSDADRGITAVRLPPLPAPIPGLPASAAGITGFLYVGVVQGTRSGPTIHPAFIGRADTETDARWSAPLVVLNATSAVPPGSLIFTIDGRLVGLATPHDAGVAVVPAAALDDAVTRLSSAGAPPE
jgi:hypothetical protein